MPLISDIQVLEPGSEVLLFELDGTDYGADVLRFHGHSIPYTSAELIAAGVDVREACNQVLGKDKMDAMIGDLYDALRAKA